MLLASPSNPTGTSITLAELTKIIEVVRAKSGFAIIDEIYGALNYDHPLQTAASLGEDVILINSFSKYFNMTGWRLGWMVVPAELLSTIEKLAQNLFIFPSALAQHAALTKFLAKLSKSRSRSGT